MSASARWAALVEWVKDSFGPPPLQDDNPFEYVTKTTEQLEIGDYVVAYEGYIQRLGPTEYDGQRGVMTKAGREPTVTWVAYDGDEFVIRKRKEGADYGY